jgi:hypothetical protein
MGIRLPRIITIYEERVQPLQSVKTIMIVVLTVISGMDPHMISRTSDWFGKVLGLVCRSEFTRLLVSHGETP